MPNKRFLEESNLYQRFELKVSDKFEVSKFPSVNMYCNVCKSNETFTFWYYLNTSHELGTSSSGIIYPKTKGEVFTLHYACAACGKFLRVFVVKVSNNLDYIMKVGQYPGIDISIDKDIERSLGKHAALFKQGLICETNGFGIGAYSYYRRIVELTIDELLGDISELLDGDNKEKYLEALQKTKELQKTSDKIELVKDILPPVLIANGLNPLGTLYKILSEGIHNKTDDNCINIANNIRIILLFLIKQVVLSKNEKEEFTENMKILLGKRK
jgi:hypothetical protein